MTEQLKKLGKKINDAVINKNNEQEYVISVLTSPDNHPEINELPSGYLREQLLDCINEKIKFEKPKTIFYEELFTNYVNCQKKNKTDFTKPLENAIKICELEIKLQQPQILLQLKKLVSNYEKINGADQQLEQLTNTYAELINSNKKTYYQLKHKLKQE